MNTDKRHRRVHGYIAPETEVRKSSIDALGLFAKRDIPKGVVVAAWGGRILTSKEIERLPEKFRTNYALSLYPGFYIAETSEKDLDSADFINHSCEPNCAIKNLLIMVTKRSVRRNEELTADFDAGAKFGKKAACQCGSKKCRRIVYF
jgi:hypothetical protein